MLSNTFLSIHCNTYILLHMIKPNSFHTYILPNHTFISFHSSTYSLPKKQPLHSKSSSILTNYQPFQYMHSTSTYILPNHSLPLIIPTYFLSKPNHSFSQFPTYANVWINAIIFKQFFYNFQMSPRTGNVQ